METLNNVTISAARNIVRSHSARKRFLYVNRSFFFKGSSSCANGCFELSEVRLWTWWLHLLRRRGFLFPHWSLAGLSFPPGMPQFPKQFSLTQQSVFEAFNSSTKELLNFLPATQTDINHVHWLHFPLKFNFCPCSPQSQTIVDGKEKAVICICRCWMVLLLLLALYRGSMCPLSAPWTLRIPAFCFWLGRNVNFPFVQIPSPKNSPQPTPLTTPGEHSDSWSRKGFKPHEQISYCFCCCL